MTSVEILKTNTPGPIKSHQSISRSKCVGNYLIIYELLMNSLCVLGCWQDKRCHLTLF